MNLKELRELIELIQKSGVTEFEMEKSGVRVRIKKETAVAPPHTPVAGESLPSGGSGSAEVSASPLPGSPPAERSGLVSLTSPVVGTFYRAPAPDADPYIELGGEVKKGQILCVIEAMKLMNEIESECDGKVVEIMVENGQAVEYGEPLFRIEPRAEA